MNTYTNNGLNNRMLSCPTNINPDWDGGLGLTVPTASAFAPQIFSIQNYTMPTGQTLGCYGFGYYINPGTFGSGGCTFSGDEAEIIIYNTTLTSTQINSIESYLNSRYLATGAAAASVQHDRADEQCRLSRRRPTSP